MSLNCPQCLEPMSSQRPFGEGAFECLYCDGAWVTFDRLQQISGSEPKAQAVPDLLGHACSGSARKCPQCAATALRVIQIEETELDICPQCRGLFFDRGELKTLLPKVRRKGDEWIPIKGLAGFLESIASVIIVAS